MDQIFENAEQMIASADSPVAVKRALAHFLTAMFSTRPATMAHMAQVMVVTLDRADDLDGKRQAALMFTRSIRDEVQALAQARAAANRR